MSKININFNNKNYNVDKESLASATAELKNYLSTVMNGSGAVINLDGTAYNVDSTKLATVRNNFVSHLGTIYGNGAKVVVNGVEYGVDSTKISGAMSELQTAFGNLASGGGSTPDTPEEERLEGDGAEYYTLTPTALSFRSTAPLNELQEVQINGVTVDPSNYTLEEGSTIVTFPIDYLKTLNVGSYEVAIASDSKTVKGEFTVAAPELNEHGFYYNQPYSANLPMFGGDTAFFVREDGTYDIITIGKIPNTGNYTMNGNNIVTTHPLLGTITCTISSDGTEVFCNELQVAFELNGSIAITADDDYIYEYKEDLGGYEVRCIDKTKAEYCDIKTGINGIDTVKLANDMFENNTNLVIAPAIPNSITSIQHYAFNGCSSLTSITIPNSVTSIGSNAFQDCTGLTSITIPNSVTSIGNGAFYRCTGLTPITIPDSVTSIGSYAFNGCTSLTSITIPDSVTSIGNGAFYGCPINTAVIPASAIEHIHKENLKTVVVTSGVKIGEMAFYRCTSLTSITIPNSVTSIGSNAFYNCDNLTSITIPNSVTSIGSNAFYNCISLTSITIPNSVTSIGGSAFNETPWIKSKLQENPLVVVNNILINGNTCSGDIAIPNSVTSIGGSAFAYCTSLTSITIPNSVTSIGDSAFQDCTGLTSITIPNSVTSIGSGAFYRCIGLTSITYTGTIAQWNTITFGSNWNENTRNYTIYCTDGTISKDDTTTYN